MRSPQVYPLRMRLPLAATALALCTVVTLAGQTVITPPKNKYTPEQDVQLGREAAAEVRREYPIINDPQIAGYLERAGNSLVAVAPRALNHEVFEYSFTPVNLKEINAFALPGGPMFVNRGMFDAARGEGEVVGVMAHELAHVLLRHGTANATKAQNFQIGAIAGAIAGAIIGGGVGQVISQGSQFGLGAWLMKYSREYEKQADLLGAQMMARAGFDPRDLARMFETIEREAQGQDAAAVAEQSPQSGQPFAVHPAGGRQAHHRQATGRQRFCDREVEVRGPAGGQVDGRHHARRREWQRRGRGPGVGRHRRAAGPGAFDAISHPARRAAVPGQRARQLDRRVGQQRHQVRAAERTGRVPGTERVHARRGAGRGAVVVARSRRGDRQLRQRDPALEPGDAGRRRPASGGNLAAGGHRHDPAPAVRRSIRASGSASTPRSWPTATSSTTSRSCLSATPRSSGRPSTASAIRSD